MTAGEAGPEGGSRRGLLRSAALVGFVTLLSRISGLARETVHAHFLGTALSADAFRIALIIPNVLRRLVGEGAISSAFVPVFTRSLLQGNAQEVRTFAEKFLTLWSVVLVAATLIGMALAGQALLSLQALDVVWDERKLLLTVELTRWLFPYLFLVGLSAVAGGILNAKGGFVLPTSTSLLFNLAYIAAGYALSGFFPGERAVYSFTIGVLVGGALQIAILVPPLWKMGIRPRLRWPFDHAGVREVLRLFLPGTFGAGIYQLNVMVSALLAMRIPGEGPVSALGYASRLMEFVLGVFVFGLSTVSLTTLSERASKGDRDGFRSTLSEVMRLTAFITIPSAVGLSVLREPVIALILRGGAFNAESARLTAEAFQAYMPGVLLVGLGRVLISAFYALKDTWTPVKIGAVNLAVNAVAAWLLLGPLEHSGIALASSIAALVQSLSLLWAFRRKQRDLLDWGGLGGSLVRSGAAALVMGVACWGLLRILPGLERGKTALGIGVFATIAIGAAIYFTAAWVLRAPELEAFRRAILVRRSRGRASGGTTR